MEENPMSEIQAGEEVMIDPHHPFFGGRMGVFEFMIGQHGEIAVFSKPRQSEDETKIYFMVRPQDEMNNLNFFLTQEDSVEPPTLDDQVCEWLNEDQPPESPLHTMVIDT